MTRQIATWKSQNGHEKERVDAHCLLAEIEMLGVVYGGPDLKPEDIKRRVEEHCRIIRQLAGDEPHAVSSMCRQFQRYLDWWDCVKWRDLAQAAVAALPEVASSTSRAWVVRTQVI